LYKINLVNIWKKIENRSKSEHETTRKKTELQVHYPPNVEDFKNKYNTDSDFSSKKNKLIEKLSAEISRPVERSGPKKFKKLEGM